MVRGLERNSPSRRRMRRTRSPSPRSLPRAPSPEPSKLHAARPPQPYMKQVKLHPSGCQQWSSQIVTGGGIYMAYASTLTVYVYDVTDFSLVTILGGIDCNVHSVLWHPSNFHRLIIFSTNGRGTQWDVRSEARIMDYNVGAQPACSAWDPTDQCNLAVVSKGGNETCVLRNDDSGRGEFRKGYIRRNSDESLAATCVKWSQHEPGVLVVGWTDGRISFSETSTSSGKGKTKLVLPNAEGGSVVDLRHDPHGGAYVLVGYTSGSVVLWDAAAHCSISSFDRCVAGLVGIRWMAWAPGNFLALSSKTGVARIFNISQKHSIGTVRLGETGSGVRDMAWLPAQPCAGKNSTRDASTGPRALCGFRDGSLSVADTAFRGGGGAEVHGSSSGGGGSGAIPWASKAGHIETVFACAHRPGDPDTLATGSYGSSVKVWHVPTMDLKVTLSGQTGAIYSVAWSADGERIASTSGEGTVWIWDAESGKAQQRLRLHSRAAHRVQWDPFNTTRLASVGADRSLLIFSEQGTVERVYVHPDALFGCEWCPSRQNVIATGCRDGHVRIYDVSWVAGLQAQYVLAGHTQRVFNVCWSPLLSDTLASGSDDGSIMVWRFGEGTLPRSNPTGARRVIRPSAVLRGHTSNVRPLHWNSEIPWLLLSGSWDGTVRAWDIRHAGAGQSQTPPIKGSPQPTSVGSVGACIAVMSDHVADVYGLSASPGRPFLYASVSRDTTLRQFTLEGVVSSIKTRAVIGNTLAGFLGGVKEAMLPTSPTSLCGHHSKLLETQLRDLRNSEGISSTDASRQLFDFFWGSDGIDTFWEVIRWVTAAADASTRNPSDAADPRGSSVREQRPRSGSRTSGEGGDTATVDGGLTAMSLKEVPQGLMVVEERVVHRNARRASDRALAKLLASSPSFIVQDRRLGRSDRVERACRLHLAAGDLQSSCEALVTLGKWERALALSPGVGMEYWRRLTRRYAEVLQAGDRGRGHGDIDGGSGQGDTDVTALAATLLVSSGRPMEAIEVLKGSDDALTLAITLADGGYAPPALSERSHRKESGSWSAEWKDTGKVAAGGSHAERGGEEKLLTLLGNPSATTADKDRGGESRLNDNCNGDRVVEREEQASPKNELDEGIHTQRGGRMAALASSRGVSTQQQESKGLVSTPENPPSHTESGSHDWHVLAARQRDYGEAVLRSITESKAQTFFRASQPALAAAAMLSICDGTRAMAAPALSFLLRGDEPELAYAAARALRFPARELSPLAREMARRAEAWGDVNLAVELVLNAEGEEDGVGCGHTCGSSYIVESALDEGGRKTDAVGGFWSSNVYGACGEEAGPRGAALIISRARNGASSCPHFSLRSKESYLEDAAVAVRRGQDIEAVRLLVLGGDMEQAAKRGVSFLWEIVPALSLSPRSLGAASAMTRLLGSGSGLSSLANQVTPCLRAKVLAYASYVGALAATARGYHSVVSPLFGNASACTQAAQKMATKGRAQDSAKADEKNGVETDGSRSPDRRNDPQGRRSSRSSDEFPPCMSTRALMLAAAQHLTTCVAKGEWSPTQSTDGPHFAKETELGVKNLFRDEASQLCVEGTEAVGELSSCAEVRYADTDDGGPSPRVPDPSTTRADAKGAGEALNDDIREPACSPLLYSDDKEVIGRSDWNGTPLGATGRPSPRRGSGGEIVVGGSRLPSCRRGERTVRGNRRDAAAVHKRDSMAGNTLPRVFSPNIGKLTWPLARGAAFLLEDGETTMELSDAVMWAKVNPFSPLNTGSLIMPF